MGPALFDVSLVGLQSLALADQFLGLQVLDDELVAQGVFWLHGGDVSADHLPEGLAVAAEGEADGRGVLV